MLNAIKKLDWILIGAVLLLLTIGLLSIASASLARTGAFTNFKKQIVFAVLGLLIMFLFSFLDYRILRNHSGVIMAVYLFSVALLALLLIFGKEIRGAVSWFRFGSAAGGLSFEPIEVTKLVLIATLAKYFSTRHVDFGLVSHLVVSGFYVMLPTALVLLQPDLGSAILIVIVWIGIMLVSGIRIRHLTAVFLIFAVLAGLSWQFFLKDYQKDRILAFVAPHDNPLSSGYNVLQAAIAIGSGGFWGKGLGHGSQSQLNFLPEQHTDFIFATMAEEWGFAGVLFVLALWGIIFWRLFIIGLSAPTNFARLFVFGFTVLMLSHLFINIGMNTGLFPITGISLPLLSYGGSNLIATLAAFGIVLNISAKGGSASGGKINYQDVL